VTTTAAHGTAGAPPAPGPPGEAEEASTGTSPSPGTVWRAARGPLALVAVLLLLGLLLAYTSSRANRDALDPRSVGPSGSHALATLLERHGVQVDRVRTTEQARDRLRRGVTLLVTSPDLLDLAQRTTLADTGSDVVLLAPGTDALRTFLPTARVAGHTSVEPRDPACTLPAAVGAGDADTGGQTYEVHEGAGAGIGPAPSLCYAAGGRPSLVQGTADQRTVTVLGAPAPLTNRRLDEHGNAALALRLLGANPHLVWYLPDPTERVGDHVASFGDLVPDRVWWGLAQVVAAVVLVALWRARRLGPVVAEPLPVVVRATETVEGRARLYRRGRARDRAADSLRAASRARLVPLLGLPRAADPNALVSAAAARTGRLPGEVGTLLYGAAPGDDAAMVRLAEQLDTLEGEVRRL